MKKVCMHKQLLQNTIYVDTSAYCKYNWFWELITHMLISLCVFKEIDFILGEFIFRLGV
jgi:hypothetical protein